MTSPTWQMRNPKFGQMKHVGHSMLTAAADNPQISGAQHSKGPQPFCVTIQCDQWGWGQEHRGSALWVREPSSFHCIIYIYLAGKRRNRARRGPQMALETKVTSITPTHVPLAETQSHGPTFLHTKWSLGAGQERRGISETEAHSILCHSK